MPATLSRTPMGRALTGVPRIGKASIERRLTIVERSGEGLGEFLEGEGVSSPSRRRETLLSKDAVRRANPGGPAGAARPHCRISRRGAWGGP